jgi:sugar phosphate isomerase/epimerase
MSIACSTSAFKKPLDEALAAISQLGFDYVDLVCIPGFGHIIPAELAKDFDAQASNIEALLKRNKLAPVAMNAAFGQLHQRGDAEAVRQRVREMDAVARLMNRLGVGVCSFYPGYRAEGRDWEEVLADTARSITELMEAADKRGVAVGVELHFATPFETVPQGRRLLEAVPGLNVVFDPSHYAMQRIDPDQTASFLDRTVHVHMRDAAPDKMCVPPGEGTVDFKSLVHNLAVRNYAGHYSIEYLPNKEGREVGPDLVKMREILEELV